MIFTALTVMSASSLSHGQVRTPAQTQSDLQALASANSMFQSFDNRFKGVKGGITLLEEYVPGKITMSKGRVVNHNQVNYDAYNDELLVLRDNQETIVTASLVKHFVLWVNGDTAHFTRFVGPEGKMGFFQKMGGGSKAGFYKKVYKELREPDYKGAYSQGRQYAEFIPAHKYFVHLKGKKLTEFRNRKTFLQHFQEHEKALEDFIKREDIDFKDEADLKKLFSFLNEM
jgi:hypothetical protein